MQSGRNLRNATFAAALLYFGGNMQLVEGQEQVFDEASATAHTPEPMEDAKNYYIKKEYRMHPHMRNAVDRRKLQEWEDFSFDNTDVCARGVEQLKKGPAVDYNEVLRQGDLFTDETFTFPDAIHWTELAHPEWPLAWDEENIDWRRISDKFGDEFFSLWGDGYIDPTDAIQGQLGNCWLIVAAMSMAENPDRIHELFEIEQKNSVGVYAAQMWLLGMPITVVVDDYLPLDKYAWDEYATRYAKVGQDGALWGPLMEKFSAKFLGNYEIVDAGIASDGIEWMTGAPSRWYYNAEAESLGVDLWDEMLKADERGDMISAGTEYGPGTDQEANEVGLPYMHAFSVMKLLTVTDQFGTDHRLVQMRNPWGEEWYEGDWSDYGSDRWTEDLRAQADHYEANDGKFFMSYEDYLQYIELTEINMNVDGMQHSSFARFNDEEPWNPKQVFWRDPTIYNEHKLTIFSAVRQNITVTAHTYKWKHYHGPCEDLAFQSEVIFGRTEDLDLTTVNPGALSDETREIGAFERMEYVVYTAWSDDDPMPKDWSITVWSDQQPVSISHNDGFESDSFDYIKFDENIEIPTDFSGSSSTGDGSSSGTSGGSTTDNTDTDTGGSTSGGSSDLSVVDLTLDKGIMINIEIDIDADLKLEIAAYADAKTDEWIESYSLNGSRFQLGNAVSFTGSYIDFNVCHYANCAFLAAQGAEDYEFGLVFSEDDWSGSVTMDRSSATLTALAVDESRGVQVASIKDTVSGILTIYVTYNDEEVYTKRYQLDLPSQYQVQSKSNYETPYTFNGEDMIRVNYELEIYGSDLANMTLSIQDLTDPEAPTVLDYIFSFFKSPPGEFSDQFVETVIVSDSSGSKLGHLQNDLADVKAVIDDQAFFLSYGYTFYTRFALKNAPFQVGELWMPQDYFSGFQVSFWGGNLEGDYCGCENEFIEGISGTTPTDPTDPTDPEGGDEFPINCEDLQYFFDVSDGIINGSDIDFNRLDEIYLSWEAWTLENNGQGDYLYDMYANYNECTTDPTDPTDPTGPTGPTEPTLDYSVEELLAYLEAVQKGTIDEDGFLVMHKALTDYAWYWGYNTGELYFIYQQILELGGGADQIPFPLNCEDLSYYLRVDQGRVDLSEIDENRMDAIYWSWSSWNDVAINGQGNFYDDIYQRYNNTCVTASGVNFEIREQWSEITDDYTQFNWAILDQDNLAYAVVIDEYVSNLNQTTRSQSISVSDYTTYEFFNIGHMLFFNSTQAYLRVETGVDVHLSPVHMIHKDGYSQVDDYLYFNNDGAISIEYKTGLKDSTLDFTVSVPSKNLVMKQEVDFASKVWRREIFVKDEKKWELNQDFSLVDGPIFDSSSSGSTNTTGGNDDGSYDEGYNQGYDSGYLEGYETGHSDASEGLTNQALYVEDPELLQTYIDQFADWFVDQEKDKDSDFACDSTIRIAHPIEGDDRMWAFYAGQNCADHDLLLTVVFDQHAMEHFVGFLGADLSEKKCAYTYFYNDSIACEFELKAQEKDLGILFTGGFNPLFYTQEWVKVGGTSWFSSIFG